MTALCLRRSFVVTALCHNDFFHGFFTGSSQVRSLVFTSAYAGFRGFNDLIQPLPCSFVKNESDAKK